MFRRPWAPSGLDTLRARADLCRSVEQGGPRNAEGEAGADRATTRRITAFRCGSGADSTATDAAPPHPHPSRAGISVPVEARGARSGVVRQQHDGGTRQRGDARGFTLVEVLVALALAALALLLSLSLLWQQPRVLERLEARRAAIEALEATMETLRAADVALTPRSGVAVELPIATPEQPAAIVVELGVAETPDAGLLAVELKASWVVRGQAFEHTLRTMVWQP